MLSRTTARQQRMRQQTINEDRMSQMQNSSRPLTERRSSGSKLIISSPTPSSHPAGNYSQTNHSQSVPATEANCRIASQLSSRPVTGPSALLAFLSGPEQRPSANVPISTSQTGASLSHQQHNQIQDAFSNELTLTSSHQIPHHSHRSQNPTSPITPTPKPTRTRAMTMGPTTMYPVMSTVTTTTNGTSGTSLPRACYTGGGGLWQTSTPTFSSIPPTTTPTPNRGLLKVEPVETDAAIEMDSNLSPASSELNSPMESCFENIMEDQGSDSFDLNNITPSIQLSSSIGVREELFGYTNQANNRYHPDTLQQHPHQHHHQSQAPGSLGQTPSGIRIIASNDQGLVQSSQLMKLNDDDSHAVFKASTSCPAEMQESLQPLRISPNTHGNSYGGDGQLCGTSESGGSLTGTSGMDGSAMSTGLTSGVGGCGGSLNTASMLFAPTLLGMGVGRVAMDDQRAAWARDRTKKDSHNRIERKRRDYINSQICELGSLLPEDMFRDGDCKKNKGSILKNSVEFICMLRSELLLISEVRRETNLAAKVIGQLMKRIQDLESLVSHQSQASVDGMDYQRLVQEWATLHERNIQHWPNISPIARASCLQMSDAPGSSSPGLSSVGTEDFLSAESKSVFSSPGIMAGSAPVPSTPLANYARINSPMNSGALTTRGSSAHDSPLRMMRTRCTSLTVSENRATAVMGAGANPTEVNHSATGPNLGPRLLSADVANSLSPWRQPQQQQRLSGPATSNTTIIQQQQQQQHCLTLPNQQMRTPHGGVSLTRAPLLTPPSKAWPVPQNRHSHQPHLQQQASSYVSSQNAHTPYATARYTGAMGIMQVNQKANETAFSGLSASLPANVNPLLCGGAETLSGFGMAYPFERDNDLLTQLKSEDPLESDFTLGELHFPDSNNPPPMGINASQFEALITSTTGHGQSAGVHSLTNRSGGSLNRQSPMAINTTICGRSVAGGKGAHVNIVLDPIPSVGFETDEFRFDDVPME